MDHPRIADQDAVFSAATDGGIDPVPIDVLCVLHDDDDERPFAPLRLVAGDEVGETPARELLLVLVAPRGRVNGDDALDPDAAGQANDGLSVLVDRLDDALLPVRDGPGVE